MMIRRVDDHISVSPQIAPGEIGDLAEAGFAMVINNRPDGEEHGQPSGAAICEAAQAAGLDYVAIPVTQAGFSSNQVDAMAGALARARGPVLAFCRSGTRSCNLWALAEASQGAAPGDLIAKGAGAGYDLTGIRPLLETLSGKS
jgi:uncharacterized protein (TIGR01244 family)